MFKGALIAIVVSMLVWLQPAPLQAQSGDDGWWIVLASFDQDSPDVDSAVRRIGRRAAACGFDIFNDFSGKFENFRPGYIVAVVGAYSSRRAAQRDLPQVRACVADAFVKYGRYLGE
jgi:hypothetical protein